MSRVDFPPVDEQLARLERGAVDLVERELLADKLERSRKSGKPLTVKAGFDPSTPDLHLGHAVLLNKMAHFQGLGHRVVFLIGDFTAMIGDPSGRKATRPQLTREQVEENLATYKRQVFQILDRERTVIDHNSRWLSKLGSEGLVRLAGRYTLARMMEREDFRSRFEKNEPISIHELLYPLVQGYDSIAMEADVELGGHDQIFNLLVGRDLMKDVGLEPQVVLTVPLLVGTDGEDKMSKSLDNHIAFEDEARDIYGKTMSIPDRLMWDWYLLLTDRPADELASLEARVDNGEIHPKSVKEELAMLLTRRFHGEEEARAAASEFETVFSRGGLPDDIQLRELGAGAPLQQLLHQTALAKSKSEARRLIEQGAVSLDGEKVVDPFHRPSSRAEPYLIKVGKRRFLRLRLS